MVVIDTSLIIDHIRQHSNAETALMRISLKYPTLNLCISVISIQELYRGRSSQLRDPEKQMLSIISSMMVLPYDYATAKLAGELVRNLDKPVEFPDAAIAATAIINAAKLATLNVKDFKNIKGIRLLDL